MGHQFDELKDLFLKAHPNQHFSQEREGTPMTEQFSPKTSSSFVFIEEMEAYSMMASSHNTMAKSTQIYRGCG